MDLAQKITAASASLKRDIRIVASSDFSHYIPEKVARDQDLFAIQALESLDTGEFYRRIASRNISACGYGPITAMAAACRSMGAREARLLNYTTSGDGTGDRDEVVGYAAIAVI